MITGSNPSYSQTGDGRHVYTDPQGQGWVTSSSVWVWFGASPATDLVLGPVESTFHTFDAPPSFVRDRRDSHRYYGPGKWVFIPEGYEIKIAPRDEESKE